MKRKQLIISAITLCIESIVFCLIFYALYNLGSFLFDIPYLPAQTLPICFLIYIILNIARHIFIRRK